MKPSIREAAELAKLAAQSAAGAGTENVQRIGETLHQASTDLSAIEASLPDADRAQTEQMRKTLTDMRVKMNELLESVEQLQDERRSDIGSRSETARQRSSRCRVPCRNRRIPRRQPSGIHLRLTGSWGNRFDPSTAV